MQIKSHFLSIVCASIILFGGSFIVMNTLLAKEDGSELEKQAEERQREFNKQSQESANSVFQKESEQDNKAKESQKKLLERQKEQAKKITEKKKESEEKIKKQDNDINEDSVDSESEKSSIDSEERRAKMKNRCESIAVNVQQHQNRFIAKSETRIKVYTKVATRLQEISSRLTKAGVDVSQLNSYITDIQAKTTLLQEASAQYAQSLKTNSSELCSQEDIKTIIDTKKQKLQSIIEQDKVIRQMIRETIVPYLKSLRPVSTEPSAPSGTSTQQ